MTGENWQVMRPSRNRNWASPRLIDYLEQFAKDARTLDDWPELLSAIFHSRGAGQCFPAIQVIKLGSMSTFG